MVRAPRRRLAGLAALSALCVLVLGCSGSDQPDAIDSQGLQEALTQSGGGSVPGSTPSAQFPGETNPKPIVGATPGQIQSRFQSAIGSSDPCAFVAELDDVVPDLADPAAVIATYQQLRDSVAAAQPIMPAEVAEPWSLLVDATGRAAIAAERADGDPNDKSLESVFAAPDVSRAIDSIFTWSDLNCGQDGVAANPPGIGSSIAPSTSGQ